MANKRLNYQTVSMLALTQGEAAVREALGRDGVSSPHTMAQKAAVALDNMGAPKETIAMLNTLAKEYAPEGHGQGRGRGTLEAGMTRTYAAQQVKDSDLFIRLPVGLFNIKKGDAVTVTVSDDGATLTVRA